MFLFSDYFITIAMRNTRNVLYGLGLMFIACSQEAGLPEPDHHLLRRILKR